jgi:hypothetical protein
MSWAYSIWSRKDVDPAAWCAADAPTSEKGTTIPISGDESMKPNFWRDFPKQKDVEIAVQIIVDDRPFYQPFKAPVISDLVAERHYFCRLHNLRPTSFRKTEENTPYRFYGFFESYGWHSVSWRKCLKEPPSKEAIIITALRNRTESEKNRVSP